jgi:two-component system OmpR family sensor kinase
MSTATSEGRLDAGRRRKGEAQHPPEADRDGVSSADGARTLRTPRVPLRITLVALLVTLVALALTVTGGAATSLLSGYLLDQRDDQLNSTAGNLASNPVTVQNLCTTPGLPLTARGTYLGCLGSNGIFRELSDDRPPAGLPELTHITSRNVGRYPQDPFTVPSADGSTSWRIVVQPVSGNFAFVYGIDLADNRAVLTRLIVLEVIVGLVVVALLGAAGYLLVRNSLRPLTEVEATARAIAAGDLSQRVPTGDDRTEVGRLSTALNGMLSRIEAAFRAQQASEEQARASEARMRRFVADASHELRTPLTSIRGFAELYRQGAVRTPEEIRRLMQRIEAEGARMGLLVEDLLQLARLDQQRPLTIVPVDLAEVAADVVHDARAVQPDRPIAMRLSDSLTEVPVVLGDEARLRQVVGNLVTNALTHTPPDVPVTVTVDEEPQDPDVVVVRVADEGPGMAPEDAARVFERFYRAESSRTRETGGTGLGLAIVASLVAAHGGSVDVATAPGMGATFSVRLPRSGPAPADAVPAASIEE